MIFYNYNIVKYGFIAVAVLVLTIHAYVYMIVNNKKDKDYSSKKIWIPPKPQPTLPFGLGPPPTPVKPDDYTETTLQKHEIFLLQESVKKLAFSGGISLFMSFKFNVHVSLLMQSFTMVMELNDITVIKKYLLGSKKNENGGDNLYNELYEKPKLNAAGEIVTNEVKELPEKKPAVEEEKNIKTTTATNEID